MLASFVEDLRNITSQKIRACFLFQLQIRIMHHITGDDFNQ